jgi:hypothetical protein
VEASLEHHPVFAPIRPWLDAAGSMPASVEALNALAHSRGLRVASGKPVRFVVPGTGEAKYGDYENRIFETGCIATRPGSPHDFFNALAWLAFPRTKARLNELHVRTIPLEKGRRGRFRDLLTLIDEGGAIAEIGDPELAEMLRGCRWRELFWDARDRVVASMRVHVIGHAVLEQSVHAWPGITCKVILIEPGDDVDAQAATWLDALSPEATPRDIAALPIFGYPGWFPGNDRASFYDDTRYFRPLRAVESAAGDG